MAVDANSNWSSVQNKYNSLRNSGKPHEECIKRIQEIYKGVGPENQKRLQDGYKPAPPPAPSDSRLPGNENWSDVQKMYNSLRDSGKSHDQAIVEVKKKYTGIGSGNQERLQRDYKPASSDDRPNGNDHWSDVQKMYNSLRDSGKSHDQAIVEVKKKYAGIGSGNQERLQRDYKPPVVDKVISTLDLKKLESGGGDWNIPKANMKHSKVEKFQNFDVVKCVHEKNSGTSSDPGVGGFSFTATPKGMSDQAISFSWDVFYPEGFQFAKGGKHGGVFIGKGAASGYAHSTTGSSNRFMWQREGGGIAYIYPPEGLPQKNPNLSDEGHGCGFFKDDFQRALKCDMWNTVEVGTKMNTFTNGKPNADGECRLTVNGKTKKISDIRWSKSSDLTISKFDWNTFFGGPDPSPVKQYCYFKNFQMKKY